jgi:hypothetical protein
MNPVRDRHAEQAKLKHDLNNVFMILMSHGEMLSDALRAGDPLRIHVDEMLLAAERAKALMLLLLEGPVDPAPLEGPR